VLNINGPLVELSKSVKLTPKQFSRLKGLDKASQSQYVLSILGLSRSRVPLKSQAVASSDSLAEKQPDSFRNLLREIKDASSNADHKPLSSSKDSFWIGVEIECLIPGEESDDDCEYCGGSGEETCHNCEGRGHVNLEDDNGNEYRVDCASCDGNGTRECTECDGSSSSSNGVRENVRRALSKAGLTLCSVRDDGSLSADDHTGVEVTVLLDAKHGFDKLYKVCKVLNSMGAMVNSTCGLHVHLDQRGFTRSESVLIGKRLGKYLPILTKLVPSSRRNNRYCKASVSELSGCRYHAVNMTSLSKHKTIEVRLHSGTTDARKIENWVRLLRSIVESKANVKRSISTLQGLMDSLNLSSELVEYFDRRFNKFNPASSGPGTESQDNTEVNDDEVSGIDAEAV
jgi:hypothetical protein